MGMVDDDTPDDTIGHVLYTHVPAWSGRRGLNNSSGMRPTYHKNWPGYDPAFPDDAEHVATVTAVDEDGRMGSVRYTNGLLRP